MEIKLGQTNNTDYDMYDKLPMQVGMGVRGEQPRRREDNVDGDRQRQSVLREKEIRQGIQLKKNRLGLI